MKNQIIVTFVLMGLISSFLIFAQNKDLAGGQKEDQKVQNVNFNKINVFKWIINKDYRRSYVKDINEKL